MLNPITQEFKRIDEINNWITVGFNGNYIIPSNFYQISKSNTSTLV